MDGIILDVDGTIWNSVAVVVQAWNHVIKEKTDLDVVLSEEDLYATFGKPMDEICEILFPEMEKEEIARFAEQLFSYENEFLETNHGKLYDGMKETIVELAKKYPLYIVSNCQKGYIEVMLKTMGLARYFKDFLCYGDTLREKSYTIQQLMKKNKLKDVIYVGDTTGDQKACREANIPFVFAKYGFGEINDAKWAIEQPKDLLAVIQQF